MTDIQQILEERKSTHGEYRDHAYVTQRILEACQYGRNYKDLSPIMKESLHMFAHKMGRIVVGNPNIKDHWDDISGYATLISERIEDPTGEISQANLQASQSDSSEEFFVIDYPFEIDPDGYEELDVALQNCYDIRSHHTYRLKTCIPISVYSNLPSDKRGWYTPLGDGHTYVINIDRARLNGVREELPVLKSQLIQVEREHDLQDWQKLLYVPVEGGYYNIRPSFEAWCEK